jgi:hypothetical protein
MNDTLDQWIQRVTLAALLALAAVLLTVGGLLYASPSRAGTGEPASRTLRPSEAGARDILTENHP